MHVELSTVRLGQLPEDVTVPDPRPDIRSAVTTLASPSSRSCRTSSCIDAGGGELGGRWAPSSRRPGAYLSGFNNTNDKEKQNGKIVMSGPQNVSLDGVVQDPDGEEGFGLGGWFVQFGGKDLERGTRSPSTRRWAPRHGCWVGGATSFLGPAGDPGVASWRTG